MSDGYEVVVHVDDEARVDALLPTIRFPDELPAEEDDGDDTDVEVLSDLFVASDRLQRDATGDAVTAFLDAAERIGDRPPYGIDEEEWTQVVALSTSSSTRSTPRAPADQIAERHRLRDGCGPWCSRR